MSQRTDYLIIGSGVAGYHALLELLSLEPNSTVTMISSDPNYPYDRPPLSKEYMRGERRREEVFFKPQDFYSKPNLKVLLKRRVQRIRGREAILDDGSSLTFRKALMATGGSPRKLNLPGEGKEGVHYLRTLDDADSIKAEKGRNPIIVGAGFIGMEVAASLTSRGLKPTVIEVKPYIWSTFVDENAAKFLQSYFESRGVKFVVGESVREFLGDGRVKGAITTGGKRIEADFALIAVGITPNVELAKESGIQVENGVIADQQLRTSNPDIYAAGDVANIYDPSLGKRRRIEHWNNAEYTGRLAARNMVGKGEVYDFLSTVWSDIFDLHVESAGETVGYDDHVVRGRMEGKSFNLIYLKGGLIHGYLAVNRDYGRELKPLNQLIKGRVSVEGKRRELEDEGSDLKALLR